MMLSLAFANKFQTLQTLDRVMGSHHTVRIIWWMYQELDTELFRNGIIAVSLPH